MASQVEIVNKALVELGESPIESLLSSDSKAIAANAVWNTNRKFLLRLHPWNFAIVRSESLGRLSSAPNSRYKYKYEIPSDCIKLITVLNNSDYKVEQQTIVTDETSCYIKYVKDITDPQQWDASFTELMSLKMKESLAYPITEDLNVKKLSKAEFEDALLLAQFHDAYEDIEDEIAPYDHSLISVRF